MITLQNGCGGGNVHKGY